RRAFVRQACCAAVGTTGLLSSLGQLRVIAAAAGDSLSRPRTAAVAPDYKALVCLFFQGGIDATNMLIPSDPAGHAAYAAARAGLTVDRSALLPIAPRRYSDGRSYGLNPRLPGLQSLFNEGKLAVLANVGTLVRPTTLADFKAGRNLPPQLHSHLDQAIQWQSGVPDMPFETGWGGRLADLLDAFNGNHQVSMSIALAGTNYFQRGRSVQPYILRSDGTVAMAYNNWAGNTPGVVTARTNGLKAIMAGPQDNALAAAFGTTTKDAIEDSEFMGAALRTAPTLRTVFPGSASGVSQNLAMVAKVISVSQALGVRRQVFFVEMGGFDTHFSQEAGLNPLLSEINGAMRAFYDATVELGVADQVTTFTTSDFGRSYVPNASGTDHGWGNHQFIMGGAVQGGDIYGRMPSLTVGAGDDTGRGRWIPSTSVDEYSATLATWFGVAQGNLPVVLPNIGRFARPNLGFL
ncbi:MAG: DUF1501 domain-containing protein, partial [Opitutaceae bacterium]|nr:DUF1501 domain-containing protein [Opitutaceae bacterium]